MKPTFESGQIVFSSGIPYFFIEPKKGDIVIFREPRGGLRAIKRISSVKNGKVYVLGDNKGGSIDSSTYGMVRRKNIVAKVIFTTDENKKVQTK